MFPSYIAVFMIQINMIIHDDYDDPNFKNGRPVMFNDNTNTGANDYTESYTSNKNSSVQ